MKGLVMKKSLKEQMDNIVTIPCKCGFKLGVREFDLDEMSAGVWGPIRCPSCASRLNDEIKKIFNEQFVAVH